MVFAVTFVTTSERAILTVCPAVTATGDPMNQATQILHATSSKPMPIVTLTLASMTFPVATGRSVNRTPLFAVDDVYYCA